MIQVVFALMSALLLIGAAVPYIQEIIRGTTKPKIVSWFTWSLLTTIACIASFSDHQYLSASLLFASTLETGLVVVLGLRHGDRTFTRLDIVCQIGAVAGIVLWLRYDSPTIAVLATIAIDFIGTIPTLRHSWREPYEETWITFICMAAGGGMTLVVTRSWAPTAVAYPLYIFFMNLVVVSLITLSPYKKPSAEPLLLDGAKE